MSREPALVTVKVASGTQLSFDGTTYVSGAEVQAPEHIAGRGQKEHAVTEPRHPADLLHDAP